MSPFGELGPFTNAPGELEIKVFTETDDVPPDIETKETPLVLHVNEQAWVNFLTVAKRKNKRANVQLTVRPFTEMKATDMHQMQIHALRDIQPGEKLVLQCHDAIIKRSNTENYLEDVEEPKRSSKSRSSSSSSSRRSSRSNKPKVKRDVYTISCAN